jgi:uncharacterized coiled-coil DUF342 family protein
MSDSFTQHLIKRVDELNAENRALRAKATFLKTWADQRSAEIRNLQGELKATKANINTDYDRWRDVRRDAVKAQLLEFCNRL